MIKPEKLKVGDTVAIVSLSSGIAGDALFRHRYELGKKRLEEEFGLKVKPMPNALKGYDYLKKHPEFRAKDLMNAFLDKEVKAIFCNIGGDDTLLLLPYINYEIIKENPKIFMGYSDTTVNHFMMYKAGLVSFYGPTVMNEFAENVKMHDYTKKYIKEILFNDSSNVVIESSNYWTSEYLDWSIIENNNIKRKMQKEVHGYEVLQGEGSVEGKLLGGCLDTFQFFIGTEIWVDKDQWQDKILFLETSEDQVEPIFVKYFLRNLIAQGIIDKIKGIIVGKPKDEKYYEEYKEVYKRIIGEEANRSNLPILYNINIGHTAPMTILPYGIRIKLDLTNKRITILESATV